MLRAATALAFLFTSSGVQAPLMAAQLAKTQDASIPVRYTDVREAAKITFQQDSTQTEEKYYLETMGTGVAWIASPK